MTDPRIRFLGFLIVISLVGAAQEARATIQVTNASFSFVTGFASQATGTGLTLFDSVDHLMDGEFDLIEGDTRNTTRYSISNSGIVLEIDHVVGRTADSDVSSDLSVGFWSTTDIPFALSGSYTAIDDVGRQMFLRGALGAWGAPLEIAMEAYSESTPDEILVLGEAGGDTSNLTQGNLTGILLAGVSYRLTFSTSLWSPSATPNGARATGRLMLAFVPEPGTAILVGLGLLGLASRRRA